MKEMLVFPDGFWWGSAWSAEQSEGRGSGKKADTIWSEWFSKEPGRFYNRVGSSITSDFYNRYRDDILLLKEIGHDSLRISLSWARLFPDGGKGELNKDAVAFYRDMLTCMRSAGIKAFVNLYHFDMPVYMQNKGGWTSKEVVDAYVNYATACFREFGDLVFKWFTFNEPIGPVMGTYIYDFHYPFTLDFKKAVQASFNSILAHAKAIKSFKTFKLDSEIGVILNLSPTYPRSDHPADVKAAEIADLFFTRSFLDPMVKGEFNKKLTEILKEHEQMPEYTNEELEIIANNTTQILGLNYYEPRRVKARLTAIDKNSPFVPEWLFEPYDMPGKRMNIHRGWEIYEKGIYDLCIDIRDNYGNIESFISENGMGVAGEEKFINEDGVVEDTYRIEFIEDHLAYLHKAISEGCNIKGYHLWTFIDCWSWMNSYKNRYGLISLDLATQKRTIKLSGRFYKKMSEANGFLYDKKRLV